VDSGTVRDAVPPPGSTFTDMRSRYVVNGAFGQASLTYPEGLRMDSQGRLIVGEPLTLVLRRIDLVNRRIDFLANVPFDTHTGHRNIDINLDDGTCGSKDDLLIGTFTQGGPWRMKADGSGTVSLRQPTSNVQTFMGRSNFMHETTYPWLAVCGRGALWVSGISEGLLRLTLAKPADPVIDPAAFQAGQKVFLNGTVAHFPYRTGFYLRHNMGGHNQLGGEPFDHFGMRPDAEIKAAIQAGWGSSHGPHPEITGRDFDNLLYYIRWNCAPCIEAGMTALPPANPDVMPPVIGNLSVTRTSAGSAMVSWTTNESAIGFASFGKNTSYGNSSPVEAAFGLTHSVTVSDLAPGSTYHFQVRVRDEAGNQSVSANVSLAP
jgi:hypothetical protein